MGIEDSEIDGTFVYVEFDEREGPRARAWYPGNLTKDEINLLAVYSIPLRGQIGEIRDSGLSLFQLDEKRTSISFYKYLIGSVRTLTGAQLAALCFVTETTINPFRLQPFMIKILKALFRTVVDNRVLKAIYDEMRREEFGTVNVEIKSNVPIRVKAKILKQDELPKYFEELSS
ncbi:MAG: hypothetical protein ACFFBD_22765 [Candidatus Hodarchaeota archaeon]